MEREILSIEIVETIGEYTILRTKEIAIGGQGRHKMTFYDVCLDSGNGDIVCSCQNLKEARKWAKEN
jgi:hypothetical protein